MRKHGIDVRAKAVICFEHGLGYKATASLLGLKRQAVRKWLYTYRAFGKEALFVTKQKKYSHAEKVEAALAVIDGKMTKPEAMVAFGIRSKTQIDTWCKLYREGGADALLPKPKGRPKKDSRTFASREEELEARVQELELENEILKRIDALVGEIEQ